MKYQKGEIVQGIVSGIEDYGFFVKVDKDYSGLVHISEIVQGFVADINNYIKLDEVIYVHILDINKETKQMKLSIKNINYRINDSNKKVKESLKGFLPLEQNLDIWTNKTLEELNINEK
ncbi:MAG: S1 RNA-binding domain-containing protein [Bacilli bacterium]|nr:S1 RNA-binding domain-containing protein [Bacilli bacterium]